MRVNRVGKRNDQLLMQTAQLYGVADWLTMRRPVPVHLPPC